MSASTFIKQNVASPAAIRELELLITAIVAVESDRVSFLFYLFMIRSGGGLNALGDGEQGAQRWTVIGGTQQISTLLSLSLIDSGVRIIHGDPVLSVSHTTTANSKTAVTTEIDDIERALTSLIVVTKNGLKLFCDHVIIAMAPNLALEKIRFEPSLPPEQTELFTSMLSGDAIKVLMSFDHAFWLRISPPSGDDEASTSKAHFSELGPIRNMFDSKVGDFPGLVALITGDAARIHGTLSYADRFKVILNQLELMYDVKIDISGATMDTYHTSTTDIRLTPNEINGPESSLQKFQVKLLSYTDKVWAHEEFSGGCFAAVFPPTGILCRYGPKYFRRHSMGIASLPIPNPGQLVFRENAIAQCRDEQNFFVPIPETFSEDCLSNHVHWASTELSLEHFGYMEGAIRSGEDVAHHIIRLNGKAPKNASTTGKVSLEGL